MSSHRAEAQRIVDLSAEKCGPYRCLPAHRAWAVLGDQVFEQLISDRLRGLGPVADTYYPWNVVDYLEMKLEREANNASP